MNSEIYDEIYVSLKKKIISSFVIGWILVTLFEIVAAVVLYHTVGFEVSVPVYILHYIVLPAGVDGVIAAVTLGITCFSKVPAKIKNYVMITGLILICLVLSVVHGYFTVCLVMYAIPIFTATVFLDKKVMLYSIAGSCTGVVLSGVLISLTEDSITWEYIAESAVIVFMILALVCMLSYLVFVVHQDRQRVLASVQDENSKLSKETRFDGLTGLQNHTSFYNVFEHKLMKARHNHTGFALAMLDIDDFKGVNDTYGHSKGDEILRFVSSSISDVIGVNGIAFRYGGDEFAIIFQNPDPESNLPLLEQLRLRVCEERSLFSEGRTVSLSIGYYNAREISMTAEEIFYKADQALYHAKYSGKNQVHADI